MSLASDDSGQEVFVRPPAHPVPTLQGPFEESMVESVNDGSDFDVPIDAVSRRTMLLEGPKYERIIAGRWKQRPGERYHPLWKLMAQMTFGLHLLARNLAKSEDEVMKILQAHVDDIDDFLERTSEDFELAHSDMHERLRCLKLPLQHGDVFDRMLEDRGFRASILEGNEKIEHIVTRTRKALKDSMKDVQKGFDATNVLDTYLMGLSKPWQRDSPEHEAVYVAMLGNVEGWKRAFMDLHLQGNKVGGILKKLMEIVAEMEKRAATVSRHQLAMSQASMASLTHAAPGPRSSAKPLPRAPTHRNSTKGSSRNTNLLRDSSRHISDGSQDGSSIESTPLQLYSGRQTPNPMATITRDARKDSADEAGLLQKPPTTVQSSIDRSPVELPADVPEEALRQAPVSMKNRLSYTLGLKPKDNSDHRISSIYYPRALGDLLRMQQSPPILKTRQISTFKPESPHSSTGDYFSAHVRGSSITLVPINMSAQKSVVATPEKATPSSAEASPVADGVECDARASVASSPGLNSHPSVMTMATPPPAPVELPAANEHRRGQESRSSMGLLSSLGEPGPEVTNSETGGDEPRVTDWPTLKIQEPGSAKREKFISGLDLPEMVMSSLAEGPDTPITTLRTETSLEGQTLDPATPNESAEPNTDSPGAPLTAINSQHNEHADDVTKAVDEDQIPLSDCDTPRQKDFVAELEADVPLAATPSVTVESTLPAGGPVEMEAPAAHFRLPSRASAIAIQVNPPPPVKQKPGLLKTRAAGAEKDAALNRKHFDSIATRDHSIQPLRLRLAKREGKMMPVKADSPGVDESERPIARSPRLSMDVIASILDQMSDTPATPPMAEQVSPDGSPKSGQMRFGPPNSAPTPPAPGGRKMVNPDYASAGAFDGERKLPSKATQRHSAGKISTISAWKDLISTATNRRHSSEPVSKSARHSISTQLDSRQPLGTTSGVDVMWFKGHNGKDNVSIPVGVS